MQRIQAANAEERPQPASGPAPLEPELQKEHLKPQPRSLLIDAVRGMAISLVALGHTNQGILHRGWWGHSDAGTRLNVIIYAFHMPAFFFVSGIFIFSSVQKRGKARFTLARIRTLLYPYVLWSIIGTLAVKALSRFMVQHPLTLRQFSMDLLLGRGVWFFPALFLCQMLGMWMRKLRGATIVAIAMVIYYVHPATPITFLNLGLMYFPFVAAGMWVGQSYERMDRISRRAAFGCAIFLLGTLCAITYKPWMSYSSYVLFGGIIGTLMLMMLARSMSGSSLTRIFAWAGEASLAIYVAGEYGQGAVRQVMEWAHITSPYPQLILPTMAAIAIPAWVYQHRVKLHVEWLFIAPFLEPRKRVQHPMATR